MNWEAIGAIGEIAGAIGVVVTLLFLARQIGQNTKATQLASVQTSTEISSTLSDKLMSDPELDKLFFKGLSDPSELDHDQRRRFIHTMNFYVRRETVAFYMHKEGTLPDELWDARVESIRGILNQPGTRLYLDIMGNAIPKEFREYLGSILSQSSTITDAARENLFDGGT